MKGQAIPSHGTASRRLILRSARRLESTRPQRACNVVIKATMLTSATAEKDKPEWTGDHIISQIVNWAINTPPIYNLMTVMAKKVIQDSVEKRGVPWDGYVQQMAQVKELETIKAELEDPSVTYPDYYLQPFHAYETGNLGWLQAYEVWPASLGMAIRTFKAHPDWSAEKCFVELRVRITDAIKAYYKQHSLPAPSRIVDMGCSTGLSTRWLAQEFPEAEGITGLDLSPYFLAVAEWERRRGQQQPSEVWKERAAPITYLHGLAEKSPFADGSLDMVNFNFVIHECTSDAITSFITESKRILRPGGVVAFVDNNPRSKTIQNLPPYIFALMKSTEPWSDQYYSFDVEAAMRAAGFREVVTVEADHRHRCVLGIRE